MYYLALTANLFAIAIGIYAIINWIKTKNSLKQIFQKLGFIPFNIIDLIKGFTIGFIAISVIFAILFLLGTINLIDIKFDFNSFLSVFLKLLVMVIIEEIIFRSFFINGIKQFTLKENYIIFFSALVFAIVHLSNPNITLISVISASLGGVMYAYAFLITDQIWAPIGIHFGWNFIQGYFYGFLVSGFEIDGFIKIDILGKQILTGGEYGPEGGSKCIII